MKILLLLALAVAVVNNFALCPTHGKKSAWDGNKKYVERKPYCEYEHPLDMGGVHKFWAEC